MPVAGNGFERWLTCRDKICCSRRAVFPSGNEICRLASALGMPIEEIVAPLATGPGPLSYRTVPQGSAYRLALVMTRNGPQADPACGFLIELPDRTRRCGLGALRPNRCRAYPVVVEVDRVGVNADGCSCGPWSPADADPAGAELDALRAAAADDERDAAVVSAWNARLERPATHAEFLAHLRAAYAG